MTPKLPISAPKTVWGGACCKPVRNAAKPAKKASTTQLPPTESNPVSLQKQMAGM